ncbi:MAG: chromate transporter, partial [Planctomycetes bacterium]|nr:chromate transporter [Planctomycetota bacterium]
MPLWKLYLVFCEIGAVTFGGGYAMLPLFQDELVTRSGLVSAPDFATMAALAQLTPGAIGLNLATYVGWDLRGLPGALVCTAGLLTPPLVLVSAIAYGFARFASDPRVQRVLRGVRPAMLGLIAGAALFFLENSVFTGPLPLDRWLVAIGIPNVGVSAARVVA